MRASRYILGAGLVATAFVVAAPSADALSFKFDNPMADAAAGASDCGDNDVCGVSPSWQPWGLTVTATVFLPSPAGDKQIIQDLDPDNGGLGVVEVDEGVQDGNDNVNQGEAIQLHFSRAVFLNTVTFNDGDHNDPDTAQFLSGTYRLRVDMGMFGDRSFGATDFGGMPGQDFYFQWGAEGQGAVAKDFYIEGLSAEFVPEPGTLALMGMGLFGLVGRVRKRLRG